jgi:hypothetical protein
MLSSVVKLPKGKFTSPAMEVILIKCPFFDSEFRNKCPANFYHSKPVYIYDSIDFSILS